MASISALNTVTGIDGKSLEWAYEGDTVLLKIDLQEGYDLLGAYGDDGKVNALLKDHNCLKVFL